MATPESEPLTSRRALREHFTVPPEVRESLPKRRVVDVVVREDRLSEPRRLRLLSAAAHLVTTGRGVASCASQRTGPGPA